MYKYLDGFPESKATAINRATDPLNDDRSINSPLSLISKDLKERYLCNYIKNYFIKNK